MASIKLDIAPFEVPDYVQVRLPGGETMDLAIDKLDDETLGSMIEDFAAGIMARLQK